MTNCQACGARITENPQNHGDDHRCGPKQWAEYQASLLKDIRKILLDFDDRWRTRSLVR